MRTRTTAALASLTGNSLNVLVVSVQALLLIPLYLAAISPRLYGAWLASGEILVWMQAMDLGIPNLMIQRIAAAHGGGDQRVAAAWSASGLFVLGLVAAVIAVVGAAISIAVPTVFGITGEEADVLRGSFLLGTAATSVMIVTNGLVGLSRAIQDTMFMSAMLIVSAIAGLITALVLLVSGWGLWSIALGLVARAAVNVLAAGTFGVRTWRTEFREPFRVKRAVVTELLRASPATALGGTSYALMSQSEIVLVAALLRPELAVVYALTRKAADVGRSLVDMIGFATYGGFAHLIGSAERRGALTAQARILSLHLSLAIAVAAAYLAVNRSLIDVWIGASVFGGWVLVLLMSLQCVVLGHSYLVNLLYRATGRVLEGSIALIVEALVRLPLLALLLLAFGLPGLPIAAIATAATSALIIQQRSAKELGGPAEARFAGSPSIWTGRAVLFAIGAALALGVHVPGWPYVVATGTAIALGGGLTLILIDPSLRDVALLWVRRVSPFPRVRDR